MFAVLPTFEDAAREIGVTSDAVRTTPLSGQPDVIAGFNPEIDRILQSSVSDVYADFIGIVSRARGMPADAVDRIAQGRVWDGGTARQINLVDQFGGMPEALAWVAGEAGLEEGAWHARYLAEAPSGTDALIRQFVTSAAPQTEPQPGADMFALAAQDRLRAVARITSDIERLSGQKGIQAYCVQCPGAQSESTAMEAQGRAIQTWSLLRELLGS